jgi:hypothetical protein
LKLHSLIVRQKYLLFCAVKVQQYSDVKAQEAKQRCSIMKQRGSPSALGTQRLVSLVGDGAKWRITNLRQVAEAMAEWG